MLQSHGYGREVKDTDENPFVFGIYEVTFFSTSMTTSGLINNTFCAIFVLIIHLHLYCMSLPESGTMATSRPEGNNTDQIALLAFKAKVTDDPLQIMSLWNATTHFCKWPGVTCARRHDRVTMLDLQSQKLVGTISPLIGNLSFLRILQLQNNSFSGEIPPEFGHLRRLRVLSLHNNSITSDIPANLSQCSSLINVNLFNNMLVGKIPAELGELSKLETIHFGSNHLTGFIPSTFGNLSSLWEFFGSKNNLVGNIPDALCRLENLTYMVVSENSLSGTIPPCLFNRSSITVIDVGTNQIEGSLPSYMGNTLPNLEFLSIHRDKFTGSIPRSISNATNLAFLYMGRNELVGKVPTVEKLKKLQRFVIAINSLGSGESDDLNFLSSLTNATDLDLLELNENNFGGALPVSISNLSTKLAEFSVSYNQIYGNVPEGIWNLVNLEALYLVGNQFSGVISPEIGRLQKLQQLALEENEFSGIIPYTFGNLTLLSRTTLAENKLHGSIPSSFGRCQHLEELDLSSNNLTGPIPKDLFDLSSLSLSLDLSQNGLSGSVPMNVGNLKNLGYLGISENRLSGQIPIALGSCVRLEALYLQGNFFEGPIPSSLRFLRGMQDLDLSHNNLSGEIPDYIGDFDFLQNLNLSFNNLEGEVPTEGIFKNASAISIIGNSKLCGGVPEFQLPRCKSEGSKRLPFSLKSVIYLSCGLLGAILLLCGVCLFWFKKRNNEPSSVSLEHSLLNVSYQGLLKATEGFSLPNLIGTGSFGSVYKGVLNDGTIVAVKVLNLLRRGASASFIAECETLRNIRHRNLVKVLTACSGLDYQGNDFKALVYEYMVNGSLDERLHQGCDNLNLYQRLNVAIDVASALEYLHHHCQTPIVHCDLKPSNVLLDREMTAHVSDFGLAKFLVGANHCSYGNQSSSVGIRGSVGYAPPEYGMGSEVSTYGDVYSFGILLLEILTGKRPTDEMFNDDMNLHNFAKIALSEGVQGIADPVLLQQGGEDNTSRTTSVKGNPSPVGSGKISETMASIFQIGITCSAESPSERPDIGYAVAKLLVIRKALVGMVEDMKINRGTT